MAREYSEQFGNGFTGHFTGLGHTVSNLTVDTGATALCRAVRHFL